MKAQVGNRVQSYGTCWDHMLVQCPPKPQNPRSPKLLVAPLRFRRSAPEFMRLQTSKPQHRILSFLKPHPQITRRQIKPHRCKPQAPSTPTSNIDVNSIRNHNRNTSIYIYICTYRGYLGIMEKKMETMCVLV